jgi:hypothetical protein
MRTHRRHFRAYPWIVILGFLLSQGKLAASPWSLMSCDPSGAPQWRAFEQEVRAAKPGSPLYVPNPYPANDQQVIADFLAEYRSLHRETKDLKYLPAHEDRVLAGVKTDRTSYKVMRIENWTQLRCGKRHKQDYYYLVQVFEGASNVEITRAVLDFSGLMVTMMNMPASVPGPVDPLSRILPPPAKAMAQVDAELGIQGTDPEYVATFGTIYCNFAFPCLAFHENGLSYVTYHHELFEVSAQGTKLLRGKDVATPEANQRALSNLTADERLISLGGDVWTVARKASPAQIRHGVSGFRSR